MEGSGLVLTSALIFLLDEVLELKYKPLSEVYEAYHAKIGYLYVLQ